MDVASKRVERSMRGFRARSKLRRSVLAESCGGDEADRITRRALEVYRELAPEIADLTPGILNGSLAGTYEYLAYGKAMREAGKSDDEIGAFFAASYEALVARFPRWIGPLIFRLARPLLRRRLRREAEASRGAPDGEWRFRYVEADRGGHDLSFDVESCAVCSAFRRHGAEELVPHLCALDDQMSRVLDMGLRRSGTRALGAACCDFRYRAGGEPRPLSGSSLPIVR